MDYTVTEENLAEVKSIVIDALNTGTCGASYAIDYGAQLLRNRYPEAFPTWWSAERDSRKLFSSVW